MSILVDSFDGYIRFTLLGFFCRYDVVFLLISSIIVSGFLLEQEMITLLLCVFFIPEISIPSSYLFLYTYILFIWSVVTRFLMILIVCTSFLVSWFFLIDNKPCECFFVASMVVSRGDWVMIFFKYLFLSSLICKTLFQYQVFLNLIIIITNISFSLMIPTLVLMFGKKFNHLVLGDFKRWIRNGTLGAICMFFSYINWCEGDIVNINFGCLWQQPKLILHIHKQRKLDAVYLYFICASCCTHLYARCHCYSIYFYAGRF